MVATLLLAPLAAPRRTTYVQLLGAEREDLAPFGGARPRPSRPAGGAGTPRAARPAVAPPPPESTAVAATPAPGRGEVVMPWFVAGPQPGDGRLWVSPRPALPAAIAERLYGDTTGRDQVVVARLRAMVDSLNEFIDAEQRAHRIPSWTTDVAGTKFGIDSQFIHVAGIKIPTALLALLPITLPEGNYGEQQRARQLQEMREDIYYSAQRTATMEEFRRYVRELRARREAERELERRRRERQRDTVRAVP